MKIPYFIEAVGSNPELGRFRIVPIGAFAGDATITADKAPPDGRLCGIVWNGRFSNQSSMWAAENIEKINLFVGEEVRFHANELLATAALAIFKSNHPDDLKPIFGMEELREALSLYD